MVINTKWILFSIVLLFETNQALSFRGFNDFISSAKDTTYEIINSYLSLNTTTTEESTKELEKRKEIYDKFSNTVFKESSMVTKLHGILDKNFDRFSQRLLKIFPQDKHSLIEEYLKSIRYSEDNDWKFMNIMYKNEKMNTIQYFSLYGNHIGEKSNVYFIDFESNFSMSDINDNYNTSNDLLAISSVSSTKDEIQEIKSIPKGLTAMDVKILLSIVKTKAMKEFSKNIPKTEEASTVSSDNQIKDEM